MTLTLPEEKTYRDGSAVEKVLEQWLRSLEEKRKSWNQAGYMMSTYDKDGLSGWEAHERFGQWGSDLRNCKVGSKPPNGSHTLG